VFFVGFRADIDANWSFPDITHTFDALLSDQWITFEYWDRHKIAKKNRPKQPQRFEKRIEKLRKSNEKPYTNFRPWLTIRDALIGLPDPRTESNGNFFFNHQFQPGARVYPGHTGSPMDLPAKALKAGDHGVPGGENMMVLPDGNVRYFTVREAARVQTFPDGYIFHGAWSETMRQLGNAVPVKLSHAVAASVAEKLLAQEQNDLEKLIKTLGQE